MGTVDLDADDEAELRTLLRERREASARAVEAAQDAVAAAEAAESAETPEAAEDAAVEAVAAAATAVAAMEDADYSSDAVEAADVAVEAAADAMAAAEAPANMPEEGTPEQTEAEHGHVTEDEWEEQLAEEVAPAPGEVEPASTPEPDRSPQAEHWYTRKWSRKGKK